MPVAPPENFTWKNYHSYTVFAEFIELFLIQHRSFITKSHEKLDISHAIDDVLQRYVENFDEGKEAFGVKALKQFEDAPRNTRLFFANIEYLWALHTEGIQAEKKRSYALRWFSDDEVRDDDAAYFGKGGSHFIAHPGQYYQTNKYYEIRALLRILSMVFDDSSLKSPEDFRQRLESLSYEALHGSPQPHRGITLKDYCGIHAALIHLCNPDKYEVIISKNHRKSILRVFSHIVDDLPKDSCPEARLKLIRERLYPQYGNTSEPHRKYRWFFYSEDLRPIWMTKTKVGEQTEASIADEIGREVGFTDLGEEEGALKEVNGYRIQRSAKKAAEAKKRDNHSCVACKFHFHKQIVHVHHLDPLAERTHPRKTTLADLITLCPNCHYIAHYWLRKDPVKYKDRDTLLNQLSKSLIS
ncbi:HNH endonuclease [Rubritalea squalenifaciens DSM 18772]|uniref:HNH endonuclease n=1 Tax=Rubritalea squalenifaciens DSM 18772 TaxID=1123071 RepID=A0A1M6PLU1_9BACT|nr:HNH endonuclease [Rubritalea squalenifaciens]SHK08871.1 HNH endonuclease [Rubritalea squalenifaciens DSM 18772]